MLSSSFSVLHIRALKIWPVVDPSDGCCAATRWMCLARPQAKVWLRQNISSAVWIYALLARDAFPTPIKPALVSPHHCCQQSSHALASSYIIDRQHALQIKKKQDFTISGFGPLGYGVHIERAPYLDGHLEANWTARTCGGTWWSCDCMFPKTGVKCPRWKPPSLKTGVAFLT